LDAADQARLDLAAGRALNSKALAALKAAAAKAAEAATKTAKAAKTDEAAKAAEAAAKAAEAATKTAKAAKTDEAAKASEAKEVAVYGPKVVMTFAPTSSLLAQIIPLPKNAKPQIDVVPAGPIAGGDASRAAQY
jgi:hypothetical protein